MDGLRRAQRGRRPREDQIPATGQQLGRLGDRASSHRGSQKRAGDEVRRLEQHLGQAPGPCRRRNEPAPVGERGRGRGRPAEPVRLLPAAPRRFPTLRPGPRLALAAPGRGRPGRAHRGERAGAGLPRGGRDEPAHPGAARAGPDAAPLRPVRGRAGGGDERDRTRARAARPPGPDAGPRLGAAADSGDPRRAAAVARARAAAAGAVGRAGEREAGGPVGQGRAWGLLPMAAGGGGERRGRELVAAALEDAREDSVSPADTALGLLDLGLGRYAAAFERMRRIAEGSTPMEMLTQVPTLMEAAFRCGRLGEVKEVFDWFADWADATGRSYWEALVERCRAMLEPEAEAGGR